MESPEPHIDWRGAFTNAEVNRLHADAFDTGVFADDEWDWVSQTEQHSLGWVTARLGDDTLAGFVNVVTDGFVHAWLQDLMVDPRHQRSGIGVALVGEVRTRTQAAGCEWLHVDFDEHLRPFYFGACGFEPTTAGLIDLT
ncbi:MAG: GNAT family N-acetyltransferase [Ilumatobacter sp.]|uniref:GNAT family N-acetyltransferase n=1 Tax=Ilumatobacter sp. TaxID=1967498 RepID=UPI00262FCFAB|nr:GNAT family N-acetyltransferase [Ilumatobacter sp.]MDJ0770084.1 GNAT family N-acetyltransferase [Ilumatobacter sp.]